jgi:hypothetical protein
VAARRRRAGRLVPARSAPCFVPRVGMWVGPVAGPRPWSCAACGNGTRMSPSSQALVHLPELPAAVEAPPSRSFSWARPHARWRYRQALLRHRRIRGLVPPDARCARGSPRQLRAVLADLPATPGRLLRRGTDRSGAPEAPRAAGAAVAPPVEVHAVGGVGERLDGVPADQHLGVVAMAMSVEPAAHPYARSGMGPPPQKVLTTISRPALGKRTPRNRSVGGQRIGVGTSS